MRSLLGPLMRWALAVILLASLGCTADYGRLSRSRDVDDLFARYEVYPEYRYYSFGGMAISGGWREVLSPTPLTGGIEHFSERTDQRSSR